MKSISLLGRPIVRRSFSKHAALSIAGAVAVALVSVWSGVAQASEVNIYSSRHYDTDDRLYSDFEAATGIKVNRIEAEGPVLLERILNEGENSPADLFLTTDAGMLWRADEAGAFQGVSSAALEAALPARLRHPEGHWFGFSKRARVIFYDKERISEPPLTYEALADEKYKGLVCTRASSNIYMLSLMASIIEADGTSGAKSWAQGLWNNRARDPEGGDTDQLRAIVSGQCAIAIANTYYFARALRTNVSGLTGHTDKIGIVFPNQEGRGTHVNISGGGVTKYAPHRENAIKFLEYLTSASAQSYFANGNDEYPVIEGEVAASHVAGLGSFKEDALPLVNLGKRQAEAQQVYDSVGYK